MTSSPQLRYPNSDLGASIFISLAAQSDAGFEHVFDYYTHLINNWDATMARKTYRIELKADFADDKTHEVMLQIAKQTAKDFLSSAMLIQDGRAPAIALFTDDLFVDQKQIDLLEPNAELHKPE